MEDTKETNERKIKVVGDKETREKKMIGEREGREEYQMLL